MTGRVLVLGGTGMLGNAVLEVLEERGIEATATARSLADLPDRPSITAVAYDVLSGSLAEVVSSLGEGDLVVNCIGVIKHLLDESDPVARRSAIRINADFPYELAALAETRGFRVIQIATDCVYSGRDGHYAESAPHDAIDVYGQSKSLGEVPSDRVLNLRCSIIGLELKQRVSLLEWVLAHPDGSSFSGYLDHRWNGVTARAFAEVVVGILATGNPLSGSWHLLPADEVDKAELSSLILRAWGRTEVTVAPVVTGTGVDRTLSTDNPQASDRLWRDAGYDTAPTIARMVNDLALSATPHAPGA